MDCEPNGNHRQNRKVCIIVFFSFWGGGAYSEYHIFRLLLLWPRHSPLGISSTPGALLWILHRIRKCKYLWGKVSQLRTRVWEILIRWLDILHKHFVCCLILLPLQVGLNLLGKRKVHLAYWTESSLYIALCCSVKFNTLLLWIKECIIQVHKEMHISYTAYYKKAYYESSPIALFDLASKCKQKSILHKTLCI